MIGDVVIVDGIEFEVVWSGGEGLAANRETKRLGFWTPPHRLYNKTSDYWKQSHKKTGTLRDVDNPISEQPGSEHELEQPELNEGVVNDGQ